MIANLHGGVYLSREWREGRVAQEIKWVKWELSMVVAVMVASLHVSQARRDESGRSYVEAVVMLNPSNKQGLLLNGTIVLIRIGHLSCHKFR